MTGKIVTSDEEKVLDEICEKVGVTYLIVETGEELQSDTEKKDQS